MRVSVRGSKRERKRVRCMLWGERVLCVVVVEWNGGGADWRDVSCGVWWCFTVPE